jgi:hypothetical protein
VHRRPTRDHDPGVWPTHILAQQLQRPKLECAFEGDGQQGLRQTRNLAHRLDVEEADGADPVRLGLARKPTLDLQYQLCTQLDFITIQP